MVWWDEDGDGCGTHAGSHPRQDAAPAGLPGADASLLRQAGRGFHTGVVAAVAFVLGFLVLASVSLGEVFPLGVPLALVVGSFVGPLPGLVAGLACGLAARRARTLRSLRVMCGLVGAAVATASLVVVGLLTQGLVPFLLGLVVGGPLLPGVSPLYSPSGGYVLTALYGALVGALHACWAASGPTSLTRPCGSLTCVPSLLLTRPR